MSTRKAEKAADKIAKTIAAHINMGQGKPDVLHVYSNDWDAIQKTRGFHNSFVFKGEEVFYNGVQILPFRETGGKE